MGWQQWWHASQRFIFQAKCPLCGRSTTEVLCHDCTQQLQSCAFSHPNHGWRGTLPLFAWGQYQAPLKRAIATLKYQNSPQVAEPLGIWLAEAWQNHQPPPLKRLAGTRVVVVPIPLHHDREQQRGYNQAKLIAENFCRGTVCHLNTTLLTRSRATAAQYSLSVKQRQENLHQAFRVEGEIARQLKDFQILLIDDIYTTGATATAAASVLTTAQCSVLGVATVAESERYGVAQLQGQG
jgi:ComF family protein